MESSKIAMYKAVASFLGMATIVLILVLVAGIVMLTRGADRAQNTITVEGYAEVFTVPDIAEFTFTVSEKADTVTEAQESVTKTANKLIGELEQWVSEEDIRTVNYQSYPQYEWRQGDCKQGRCPSNQVLVGYELSHQMQVVVRDLDDVSSIVGVLGENAITNLQGPRFTVDDPTEHETKAQAEAIEHARAKAKELAKQLDVRLGKVVYFYEGGDEYAMHDTIMMAREESAFDGGIKATPSIPAGQNKITAQVSITYKIK